MFAADLRTAIELFGPVFVQIYGQGESPMTITRSPPPTTSASAPATPGSARPACRAPTSRSRSSTRTALRCPPARPAKSRPRRRRDERLLAATRGDRRGDARRLAAHRRHRQVRRRRLPDPDRPLQGHDHLRRQQHLPARGRGDDPASSPRVREVAVVGVADEFWGESVLALVVLRDGDELSEAEVIAHCRAPISQLQEAQTGRVPRRAADQRLRQGAEARAEGPPGRERQRHRLDRRRGIGLAGGIGGGFRARRGGHRRRRSSRRSSGAGRRGARAGSPPRRWPRRR